MSDTQSKQSGQKTYVDKLGIILVEEEGCEDTRSSFHRKSRRRKSYEATKTRTRRRRNKIAPTVLPTAEEGPYGEGTSGTQRRQHGSKAKIFDNKPIEGSDDHVVVGFCETPDSFSQKKNSALAL